MREKRALIISYHFYPEPVIGARRPTELVRSLRQAGWRVDVLTRRLDAEAEGQRGRMEGIGRIKSIYKPPGLLRPIWFFFKRMRALVKRGAADIPERAQNTPEERQSWDSGRKANEALIQKFRRNLIAMQALLDATKSWVFLSACYLFGCRISGTHYDLVLSSSPPASSHLLGMLSRRLFNAKWVADLRDPIAQWDVVYPECKSALRIGVEDYLEKQYMKQADSVVVTTPSLCKELNEKYFSTKTQDPVSVIYNGFDRAFVEPKTRRGECVTIVYAGALYLNRDPLPFFQAIKQLKDSENIDSTRLQFHLYGDCEHWNGIDLNRWIGDRNLEDSIRIHGFLAPSDLEPILEQADILVNFAQTQPQQIPAKTFDYLAYPAVSLVVAERESDTATFIMNNGLGYVVDSNAEEIASVLLCLYRMLVAEKKAVVIEQDTKAAFSRKSQNARYIALCEDQCGGGFGGS